MEQWDLYDINRIKLGKTMFRGEKTPKDKYRIVVHACIFNSKGEMLIQQRQSDKDSFPNMWDLSVGGSVLSGETSQEGIEREILEEIGVKIDLRNIRPHITINFDEGFNDIYLITKDIDDSEIKLQEEEVQNAKWASLDEINEMLDAGTFIPYFSCVLPILFETRVKYGWHKKI